MVSPPASPAEGTWSLKALSGLAGLTAEQKMFICSLCTLETNSAAVGGLHTSLINSINDTEKLITLVTLWGPTKSLYVTTLGLYSHLIGTHSPLNGEDGWRVREAARAKSGGKILKVTQQIAGSAVLVQRVPHCSALTLLSLFTPWKYLVLKPLKYYLTFKSDDGEETRRVRHREVTTSVLKSYSW